MPALVSDQDYTAFRAGYAECMVWANTFCFNVEAGYEEGDAYNYTDAGDRYAEKVPDGTWYATDGIWSAPIDMGDADDFLRSNYATLQSLPADMGQHGHDFALSRNRHGAGFWDRGYGPVGDALTEAAHAYGEHTIFLGGE